MIGELELEKIKEIIAEFLQKMALEISDVTVESLPEMGAAHQRDYIKVNIVANEPQILIGQNGQTLFEFSRLLMIILNKKLVKDLYLDLDINHYKQQKIEYLKKMAKELADEVKETNETKALPPMPSHERRIVHSELALRQDVITSSQGEGTERHIVISPK